MYAPAGAAATATHSVSFGISGLSRLERPGNLAEQSLVQPARVRTAVYARWMPSRGGARPVTSPAVPAALTFSHPSYQTSHSMASIQRESAELAAATKRLNVNVLDVPRVLACDDQRRTGDH